MRKVHQAIYTLHIFSNLSSLGTQNPFSGYSANFFKHNSHDSVFCTEQSPMLYIWSPISSPAGWLSPES